MIDVHVLVHSGTKDAWLQQCLASLVGQPCVVHVVQGVEGSVGAGRALGYRRGVEEFVSYVDSDDYVLPGVMQACLDALGSHHAVVTNELVERDGLLGPRPKARHHLSVYRRAAVEPLLDHLATVPRYGDTLLRDHLRPVQLATVGYVWRDHAAGVHRLHTFDAMEAEHRRWPWRTA